MAETETSVRTYSQMLQDGLDEVFSSESYRRFLNFLGDNPNYSYRNVLLILQQCPSASKVRGFRAWMGFNRVVREGQHGLRIAALFDKGDQDDKFSDKKPARKEKHEKKADSEKRADKNNFRMISVFDVSQTSILDEDAAPPEDFDDRSAYQMAANPFKTEMLEGEVPGYGEILEIIRSFSPWPIRFRNGQAAEGACGAGELTFREGMSQLHTLRAVINQIARCWRVGACVDGEQLAIEAESIAYIVCQYLGLDTSEFSFQHIAKYSFGKEQKRLEAFLDAIQKTALYFIDSFEGVREARRLKYDLSEYFLFINPKTAMRMLTKRFPVYLVQPDKGELLVMKKKQIEEHKGPFAADRSCWFLTDDMAA